MIESAGLEKAAATTTAENISNNHNNPELGNLRNTSAKTKTTTKSLLCSKLRIMLLRKRSLYLAGSLVLLWVCLLRDNSEQLLSNEEGIWDIGIIFIFMRLNPLSFCAPQIKLTTYL